MKAIAFAIIYLASEVGLASRRREGARLSLAGLMTDAIINVIAFGGFIVCLTMGA